MSSPTKDALYQVRIHTGEDTADLLQDALAELGLDVSGTVDADTLAATVCCYSETQAEAELVHQQIADLLAASPAHWPDAWELEPVSVLPREDWAESWKRHFHVERASRRLIVRPSWEEASPQPGDQVLTLDPGMSFGTGQHATTQACLRFIDELSAAHPGAGFIDLGCGSGILAIAALRLGMGPVVAMDYDPIAVTVARENANANGIGPELVLQTGDVRDWRPPQQAPVVAANILAVVLRGQAANIAACLSPDGPAHLILAGILSSQYADVAAAFAPYGLREYRRSTRGDWTSGVLQR